MAWLSFTVLRDKSAATGRVHRRTRNCRQYSGVETFYEEAGRRLAARGHQMTAYCRSCFTPEKNRHNEIRIVRLPTIRSKHLETLVHTFLSTVHSCFSDCDIVHFHTLGPSLFAYWPRLFGKKTVVSVQGLDWQRKKWSWLARQVLRAGEASIWLPNKTVVVSHALEAHYRAHYGKQLGRFSPEKNGDLLIRAFKPLNNGTARAPDRKRNRT